MTLLLLEYTLDFALLQAGLKFLWSFRSKTVPKRIEWIGKRYYSLLSWPRTSLHSMFHAAEMVEEGYHRNV